MIKQSPGQVLAAKVRSALQGRRQAQQAAENQAAPQPTKGKRAKPYEAAVVVAKGPIEIAGYYEQKPDLEIPTPEGLLFKVSRGL
jgi:hypothetical protein